MCHRAKLLFHTYSAEIGFREVELRGTIHSAVNQIALCIALNATENQQIETIFNQYSVCPW